MKLSKSKKIILLISGFGILTTSIVIPFIVLNSKDNNQKNESDEDKVKKIISKIKDRDILIAPNISTENQNEIQSSIKNQLQKENQTLTLDDLLKITTTISSLTLGNKIEITLIIKVNSVSQNLKIYVEKANLLKNSNIFDGFKGTIFQDSFGNLWAMGEETKLQVLKVNSKKDGYVSVWSNDNDKITGDTLLRNSNINNGRSGTIFQDEFKNLWAMGYGTKLQVLKVNLNKTSYVDAWTDDENSLGLLNGSSIINGRDGVIFQDEFKNLWTMGYGTKLQVLKVNSDKSGYESTWIDDETVPGLLNGSNIITSLGGTIFQDSFKNLWAIGAFKKLQVLKVNSDKSGYVSTWIDDETAPGLLNDSNITDGFTGIIFQDSFENLWTMANNKSLQILKAQDVIVSESAWKIDNNYENAWKSNNNVEELLKNSNINNGFGGTIFQDSFKNLWAIGAFKKLQVLKVNSKKNGYINEGWTNDTNQGLLNGSNNNSGVGGTIFQDSFKNLWTIGEWAKLQVLKVNSSKTGYVSSWIDNNDASGLLKNSNIIIGYGGTIFQDSFENLWTMGFARNLQVLKVNSSKKGYVNSWQN